MSQMESTRQQRDNASSSSQGLTQPPSRSDTTTNNNISSAYYGILPAVASTMCCWGPPLVGMVGGAVGGASAARSLSQRIGRYRPYLLGLSATMIGYSFYKVYYLDLIDNKKQQEAHVCCEKSSPQSNSAGAAAHSNNNLQFQRAVVWGSLAVAIAGASYGRVKLPRGILSSTKLANYGNSASRGAAGASRAMQWRVDGMACQGCANKVESAVQGVAGVHKVVTVDHATGSVLVETTLGNDANLLEQSIRAAIEKAGYHVK